MQQTLDSKACEEAECARARSQIYAFFAGLFRAEVTLELIEQLKSDDAQGKLCSLGIDLGEEFLETPDEQLVEDLAVEFTRLFIGPAGHINPHQSVHTEHADASESQLMGPEAVAVKSFVEATGLTYREDFSGCPDHISAVLELMQQLCERESEGWKANDEEDAIGIRKLQKQFFSKHVESWIPAFCDKVTEKAQLKFYAEIALALQAFIRYEKEQLPFQEIPLMGN